MQVTLRLFRTREVGGRGHQAGDLIKLEEHEARALVAENAGEILEPLGGRVELPGRDGGPRR